VGFTLAATLRDLFPDQWQTERFDRLLVHKATYEAFKAGKPIDELIKSWSDNLASFRNRRKAFLIYSE
jgi:hypothetical protein